MIASASETPRALGPSVCVGALVAVTIGIAMAVSPTPWTLTMDTGSGFLGQTLPAFRTWMAGRIPEWNDLLWGGLTLLGDCSNAVLYPPHLIAAVATLGAPLRFFDVATALHMGLLAAGSTFLAVQLGAAPAVAAVAGLLAALCPFPQYCAIVFFPVFGAQAWWPWAFAAAEMLARPTTPLVGRAMVLGWIALAAQILVGMPEQAAYCAAVVTLWLLTRRAGLPLARRAGRLALLGAGAAAVAAPQLLPTLAFLPTTARAAQIADTGVASIRLLAPERLVLAGTGVGDFPSFFGLASLALAVVAMAARRARAAFLLVVGGGAFLLATGPATPLHGWLRQIPPFDHFRSPVKFQALAELAIVWVAALGVQVLWRRGTTWTRAAAVTLALAALGERAIYLTQAVPVFGSHFARQGIAPDVVDLLAEGVPTRLRPPGTPPPLLLDTTGPLGGGYARSLGALVGIASLRPYPVSLIDPVHSLVLEQPPPGPALASLLGVRYALATTERCAFTERRFRWPLVAQTRDFCLFENPRRPAHYEVVERAVSVETTDEMVAALHDRPDGPLPVVAPQDAIGGLARGTVAIRAYAAGRATLQIATAGSALLLVRDSLVPGWTAHVDGGAVPLYPAAGIYFAVPLAAGVHVVELVYRAPGFRAGLAIACAWALGVAGWLLMRR